MIPNLKELYADGKLSSYSSIGGYGICYLNFRSDVICPDCANKAAEQSDSLEDSGVQSGFIYWEGPPLYCDDCNAIIESEYGDPDEVEA